MNDGTAWTVLIFASCVDIATRWCLPKGLSPVVCLSLSAPSPRMRDLLARCFRADSNQRPSSFDDVVKELRVCVEAERADSMPTGTEPTPPTKSASMPRNTPRQHRRRSVDEHNAAEASIALSSGVALRQHGRSDAAAPKKRTRVSRSDSFGRKQFDGACLSWRRSGRSGFEGTRRGRRHVSTSARSRAMLPHRDPPGEIGHREAPCRARRRARAPPQHRPP